MARSSSGTCLGVEGGALVRVLAVAQVLHLVQLQVQGAAEVLRLTGEAGAE
jgi:hypothetical protein